MTSNTIESSEALPTMTSSGFIAGNLTQAAGTSAGTALAFIVKDFADDRPAKLSRFGQGKPIADVVARHERDDRKRAAIQRARAKLAACINEASDAPTIAAMRLAKGLSQAQLASLMNIPQPAIARLEKKGVARNATAETIHKLRLALGVSADQVVDALLRP
ncbi:helix-turn-helix domain-containing protein [Caballeronia grimmiae]|uniref:helix-turn-helix domain-containing protein n=1 Tax=Caballeronia grimmiae TaxID=1071679 RepID=UPI0038BB3D5F